MLRLDLLEKEDFNLFRSWIKNENELLQFAGPIFTFPITDQQLLVYINDKRRVSYKVILNNCNEIIGHCELNFENELPRLSRILIGYISFRSKGYGKIIVNEMLDLLFNEYSYSSADLNVFDWNHIAIRCYEAIGFRFNGNPGTKNIYKNEIWLARNINLIGKKICYDEVYKLFIKAIVIQIV